MLLRTLYHGKTPLLTAIFKIIFGLFWGDILLLMFHPQFNISLRTTITARITISSAHVNIKGLSYRC